MSTMPQTITIDGPVAAGKTTVGQEIAKKLNYLSIDTGFFYRAVTYLALKGGIDVKDNDKTGKIAKTAEFELISENGKTLIFFHGENITPFLRTPEVDKNVAVVSANPIVRNALTPQMRKIANNHKVIMLGRDIGTVVLPDANLKIWLDADIETRAKRRILEQKEKGINTNYQEVLKDMIKRDKIDGSRETAPMKKPKDAVVIDTSDLTIPQVIKKVIDLIESR